jgi:autotransporter-associated beta strand protein
VAVWAEQRTDMAGRISARGGVLGGDGGFVETSARERLNVTGQVDAGAPRGRPGQWLLDPNDVVIKANGGSNANVGAAPNFDSTDDAAIVDVGVLNAALTGGTSVRIETKSAGTNAQFGDIDVQAAIVPAGAATLSLIAERHITFSSGSIGAGGGALDVVLNAKGNVSGTGFNTGGGDLQVTAGGTVALGSVNAKNLVINGGAGNVTLSGGSLSGGLTVTTTGGAITQSGTLSVGGTAQLSAGGGDITLGAATLGSLTATTNGAGDITQSGGLISATGDVTLTTGGGAITLSRLDSGNFSATSGGGAITLGRGAVSGTLSASTGGGSLGQANGGLVVTGNATLNAVGGLVSLNEANNDWGGTVDLTGGTSQLYSTRNASATLTLGTVNAGSLDVRTAGGTLNLGGGTVTGALSARTGGGLLTQASALSVGGVATLNATTGGDITLADTGNQWNGLQLTGNALDVRSSGNLTVLSLTQPANRALTLSAGGNLALGASANIDTGTADLSLASLGGSFTVGGVLKGHDIHLQAQTGLNLSQDLTATGNLTLSTASGGVTQSTGTLRVSGTTAVTAGASGISLGGNGNDFGGAVSLSGGTTTVHDTNALTLGTLATGALTVTSGGVLNLGEGHVGGNLNASSAGFAITQATGTGQRLQVTGTTTLNAGTADITLLQATNDLQGTITATGGGVSLRSAGNLQLVALTQPGNRALVLDAGGSLTLPVGTGSIDTGSAALTLSSGGAFSTFGPLSGGDVTLKGTSALLTHDITASGNLVVQASAGGIDQNGGTLSVTGTSQFAATGGSVSVQRLLNSFQGGVTLAGTSSQIFGLGTLRLAGLSGGSLTAQSGGALQLGTGNLSGSLTATAGGAITQAAGGLRVSGTSSLTASGPITLMDTGNAWTGALTLSGSNVQLRATGAVQLAASTLSTLDLGTTGNISQGGVLNIGGATALDAGSGSITLLNGLNQWGNAVSLKGGAVQLAGQGALRLGSLDVGGLTVQSSGALNLGQGDIAGNLVASSTAGGISQAGGLRVGGTVDLQANGASLTLNATGNQWGGALTLAGGSTQVTGAGGVGLASVNVGALTINAAGPVNLGQGTVAGTLAVNSGSGAITQTGDLDVAGNATLQGGSLTLMQNGNRWRGTVDLSGGLAQVTGQGALRLGQLTVTGLTAQSSGLLNLGQGTVSGNLVADSGGRTITQSGPLEVTGSSQFTATGADITLTDTGNRFLGALSLVGNAVSVYNQPSLSFGTLTFNSLDATSQGGITLGTGTLTGSLTARALGGTVTQAAGGLTVAGNVTLQASAGITLGDAGNRFGGTVTVSGAATTLTNGAALRLGTSSVSGNLVVTSSGALTQVGTLTVSGTSAFDAGSGDITLTLGGNAFGGAVALRGGTAQITTGSALRLGVLDVGALMVQSAGGLDLGSGRVGGTLQARSQGATLTQTGGLSVGGVASLDAGGGDIGLTAASNSFGGVVDLAGRDVALSSAGVLRLGSFSARDLTLSAGGNLVLGSGSVSGDLQAATRGTSISQTGGLTVQGTAAFLADGNLVDLVIDNPANRLLGPVAMRGINGGSFRSANFSSALDLSFSGDVQTLTLASGGRLTLGAIRSQTFSAAARAGIVQTGPLSVTGTTTLTARGAALEAQLTQAGNDLHEVVLKADAGASFSRVQLREGDARGDGLRIGGDAGTLDITSAGALTLGGGRYTDLLLDTSAPGASVTQTAGLDVLGTTRLALGAGDATLTQADNQLRSVRVDSAATARLVSQGDYTVDAGAVSSQLSLGGPGAITLAGRMSGAGELVMAGAGSLTISSAHDHRGGTRVDTGQLVLQGTAAQPGSGVVQLGAGGVLDLRDGAVLTNALQAQGGRITSSRGLGGLAGPVHLQAATTFMPGTGGLQVSGDISDTGAGFGLQVAGTGTLILSGSNTYRGVTDVTAGTLLAASTGALPVSSAVQLAAGASLVLGADQRIGSLAGSGQVDLGRFTLAAGADGLDTVFSGSLAGSGGLTKLGDGRLTLSGRGSHAGATQVSAGELVIASTTALNAATAVTVDAGARLTVQQVAQLGSLAGAGAVDVQATQLAVGANGDSTRWSGALVGPGGLLKQGGGVFTLSGSNTLAGDVGVQAGTLRLEGAGVRPLRAAATAAPVLPRSVGMSVAAGATLDLGSDTDLGALSGSGTVQLGTAALTVGASGRSSRFDGSLLGAGWLVKAGAGSFTLGGRSSYSGGTWVNNGLLVLAVDGALPAAGALVIDSPGQVRLDAAQSVGSLSGSGALQLNGVSLATGSDGQDSRFDGLISGTGGLVKQGGGRLTLTAANRFSGDSRIEAGALQLSEQGLLGTGALQNDGQLVLSRSTPLTLDQVVSGTGSLVVTQGEVTLAQASRYTGATQVLGGLLRTTGAERLPDASAVQVAAGAALELGGAETVASLQAAGSVRLAGNLTTPGDQVYTGSLTVTNSAGVTLSGRLVDASRSSNSFGSGPLGLSGGQARVSVEGALQLGDVSLSEGGQIDAGRIALDGRLQVGGGTLSLVATAVPDEAKATAVVNAQVPVAGQPMALAEATVQQGAAGVITVAEGAALQVTARGGGSVLLDRDANSFRGALAVLSGAAFNTAWVPNVRGAQAVQSLVRLAGERVQVGGAGVEADVVQVRAGSLATTGSAALVARLPFDEIVLGRALSAPGMVLALTPAAFTTPGSYGAVNGAAINVVVGSTDTGARSSGPNAGYLTVLPQGGAQGATAVVLAGPKVGSVAAGGGAPYRFFHDGAGRPSEIPVVYNGVLPLTPAATGALSSINGDAEEARRARFQDTVRTENVTVRMRAGVIAEVGPGRASTQGSDGARPPEVCDPAPQPALSCKPAASTP